MYKWITNFAIITFFALLIFVGQASAGPNSNAILSLDLIPNGGAGNRIDNGITSGNVFGRGTKIAVEVFAKGVATSLVGVKVEFEFDASVLTFEKAENSAFVFSIPEATGANFAATAPVTLPSSGFLARAEFTTVIDVTDRDFSIGIKMITLAESASLSDGITTTDVIRFNAALSPDFDGDGMVGFADFLQFAGVFGASRGDGTYQAKYDLDGDGAIGFPDFLIFTNDFGKSVSPPSGGGGGGTGTSSGFAPIDQQAFNSLLVGKRLVTSDFIIEFVSAGRFREIIISDGSTYPGSYTYSNTGSNTGTFMQNYDENQYSGGSCRNQLTFNSITAGALRYTCNDGNTGQANWQISESSGDDHSNIRSGATRLRWGFLDSIQVTYLDDLGYIEAEKSGQIETGTDVDYFSVQVSGYGVLTVYTTGNIDTQGALQNSSGSTLATDDDGASENNFGINYVVNSGTYYIKVEGYGSETGSYTMNALFYSDDSNTWVDATALSWIVLNTSGSLGIDRIGWIENLNDKDYFKVQVNKPGVLTVFTTGNIDTRGKLLPIGNGDVPYVLASDDDSGSRNNFGIVSQVFPGTYYIEVDGYNTGSYDLHVRFEASQESTSGTSGGNFNIELVFVNDDDFTSSQKAVFQQAARHWMSIITEDLKNTDFSTNPYNEWDADLGRRIRVNSQADRYSLSAPISGKLVGGQSHDWGDCSLKGPIYVSDEKGRIIDIIGE